MIRWSRLIGFWQSVRLDRIDTTGEVSSYPFVNNNFQLWLALWSCFGHWILELNHRLQVVITQPSTFSLAWGCNVSHLQLNDRCVWFTWNLSTYSHSWNIATHSMAGWLDWLNGDWFSGVLRCLCWITTIWQRNGVDNNPSNLSTVVWLLYDSPFGYRTTRNSG